MEEQHSRRQGRSDRVEDAVVYVIDDDKSVRRSLARLLRAAGWEVEACASAAEFRGCDLADRPTCLVLDVQMPGLTGLELQEELTALGLDPAIVFVTGHGTVKRSVRAMKWGAVDFIEKPFEERDLLAAVARAVESDRGRRRQRALLATLERRHETLTTRERQVFDLVVTGLLNKQIAGRLGTSEKTVKVHRGRVMRKMQAGSLADLVRMAARLGHDAPRPRSLTAPSTGTKVQ